MPPTVTHPPLPTRLHSPPHWLNKKRRNNSSPVPHCWTILWYFASFWFTFFNFFSLSSFSFLNCTCFVSPCLLPSNERLLERTGQWLLFITGSCGCHRVADTTLALTMCYETKFNWENQSAGMKHINDQFVGAHTPVFHVRGSVALCCQQLYGWVFMSWKMKRGVQEMPPEYTQIRLSVAPLCLVYSSHLSGHTNKPAALPQNAQHWWLIFYFSCSWLRSLCKE